MGAGFDHFALFQHHDAVGLGHGRRDISSPADVPVELAAALPNAELFIAERDGHGGEELTTWMVGVTDRVASSRGRRAGR